jgi:26S proteasome regulatory subunit N5
VKSTPLVLFAVGCVLPAHRTDDVRVAATSSDSYLILPHVYTFTVTSAPAEIVRWGLFEAQFGPEVAAEADIFAGEYGEKRQADLKLRVTEHNLLTVARYYTRITTTRLAELLDLTPDLVGAAC